MVAAMESGWIAPLGPEVDRFEDEMAEFVGASTAALVSGTAAIELALRIVGVQPGDRVYCPTFTFGATAFAITHAGARPVFVDSEIDAWNVDPDLLHESLAADAARGQLPAAIVTVDLYGRTCDYDRILPVAADYGVPVIEDAAEALGSVHHGVQGDGAAGSYGLLGIFSFNGNKIITTSGGGMLVAADRSLTDRARFLSSQARDDAPWYEHSEIGFNYRMSNILAALGSAQLARLPEMIAKRTQIHQWYSETLQVDGVEVIQDPPWCTSNSWLTNIRFAAKHSDGPARVIRALAAANVEARHVWKPMHLQPVFNDAEHLCTGTAETLFAEGACLPSGVTLTRDDVSLVCDVIAGELR